MAEETTSTTEEKQPHGINITWKKKGSSKERVTFIMCMEDIDGIYSLVNLKGGFENIEVISYQEFNRETQQYEGEMMTADNPESAIYQLLHSNE